MTTITSARRGSTASVVGEVVGGYVTELQRAYLADRSSAVSTLAQLRRGAGKLPQDAPDLWGATGTERLFVHPDLPANLSEAELERAERAMFLSVTLYALHQQSRRDRGMHQAGVELGAAVRRLMRPGEVDEPIRRRFIRVGMAPSHDALAYRLREIVTLLRRDSIPLDYATLARQLHAAQTPSGLRRIRQAWGRSFHAYRPSATETDAASGDETIPNKDTT